ncbi:MAG TPA: TetR/AcrR family transcriptional regulator [Nocardioides sp.]|nr:TetR/AcrR family transcriptional regulator [Nocardioides sp.]
MTQDTVRDGRRARGDATRRRVAREAAMLATVGGLDSISVGGLAERTGVSKSGILTVFGNREAIQVAAVAEARRIYRDTVITPVWHLPTGRDRLLGLLARWRDYVLSEVFPGGCFLATTSAEYGRREGAVADAVRRLEREWLDLLEAELLATGSRTPDDDAFRIDAYLVAGVTRYQLYGDRADLDRGCRLALEVVD